MPRFLTYSSALILCAVDAGVRYGFEIMDATGLPSGTVYPALRSLERRGLVSSAWEPEEIAHAQARPARKNYAITAAGARDLERALERFPALQRAIPQGSAAR